MGPPDPNDNGNGNVGTPSCVWGPLTKPLITSVHALARLYLYLYIETSSYRLRMADYSATVIEGLKKIQLL